MAETITALPAVTIYGTPACVQCNALDRTIRSRGGDPTKVDVSADPAAEAYVREQAGDDLRLPYVEVQMPNGEHRTFSGNRRDLVDELFPRPAR